MVDQNVFPVRMILLPAVAFLVAIYLSWNRSDVDVSLTTEESRRIPLILAATTFFEEPLFQTPFFNLSADCPYRCDYSNDTSRYLTSDVAVFHLRNFEYSDYFFAEFRNPDRLNVFFSLESPVNEHLEDKKMPGDFFNMTVTYRRDSSIWLPYDRFEDIGLEKDALEDRWTDKQVEEKLKIMSKVALEIVSNCETDSQREKITNNLTDSGFLTEYGDCNGKKCDADCENDEIDKHYFYFAFENTVCPDYVTEKFWRLKQLIVPVVLKRSVLKGNVEDEYFIAVDDFESPQQLMDRLLYLTQNLDQYRRYLGWTRKYKKTAAKSRALCRICEAATKKKKYSIPDILSWWHKNSGCISNYVTSVF